MTSFLLPDYLSDHIRQMNEENQPIFRWFNLFSVDLMLGKLLLDRPNESAFPELGKMKINMNNCHLMATGSKYFHNKTSYELTTSNCNFSPLSACLVLFSCSSCTIIRQVFENRNSDKTPKQIQCHRWKCEREISNDETFGAKLRKLKSNDSN